MREPIVGRTARGAAIAAALLASVAGAQASAETDLTVRLAHGAAPGEVVFELVNEGDEAVSVLRYETPLEAELSADVFDIRRVVKGWPGVERPRYTGRVFKRAAPGPEDFVEIAPGESISAVVDLEDYYDVPGGGDYRVDYDGAIAVTASTDALRARSFAPAAPRGYHGGHHHGTVPVASDSNALSVRLEPSGARFRARPPTYNGCNAEQQAILVEATGAAEGIAGESLQSLRALPVGQRATAPRYVQWFGEYSAARYATVTDGFASMLDSLSGATLNYDCTCDEEGVFAYVYPFQLHDIYVCPTFFRASVLGTDSRAGTIVHELSHFEALVGTDDYAYGQTAAGALAAGRPDTAVDNADNFEYFAENTPALPMANDGTPVETPEEETPDPTPQQTNFVALPLDSVVRGSLAEDELALYRTEGADKISLTSLRGDADLYVFDSPEFSESALVCSANAFSADSTLDVCELPPEATYYLAVLGYTATDYELVATAQSGDREPPPEVLPPVQLASGQSDAREIAAEGAGLYVVTAPARITLTTSRGNADLFVFSAPTLQPDEAICISTRPGNVDDVCELPGSGTVYVVVYAEEGASYRITVDGIPGGGVTPVGGGGTTTGSGTGGGGTNGSGGGTTGGTTGPGPVGGTPTSEDGPVAVGGGGSGDDDDDGGGGLGAGGWGWLVGGALVLGLRRTRPGRSRAPSGGERSGEA